MKKSRQQQPTLRIIAGQWRGRKLVFAELPGLRPTHDRIRETLFNWLAPNIEGSRCLDLFAGSGALGLEALSRHAASCIFVDLAPKAIMTIGKNLEILNCPFGQTRQQDASQALAQLDDASVDIIFLDPPFHQGGLAQIIVNPDLTRVLAPQGRIYIEREKQSQVQVPWTAVREKSTGSLIYGLYQP